MLRLNLFLILVIVTIKKSDAVCGVCYANGITCVSKNEFHPCYDKTPHTNTIFKCPIASHICTKFGFICADPSIIDIKPACGDTSLCGVCTGVPNGRFTCTSRTTFTMCMGGNLTNQRGSCPKGYLCDPKNYNVPCVRSCFVDETAICDLGTPIDQPELPPHETTTTIFSPTPTQSTASVTATTSTIATEPITSPVTTPTSTTATEPITSSATTPTTLEPTTSTSTTITTTTTTTTSPPISTLSPSDTVCSKQNSSGRFPYTDESNCNGYINCFWKSGTLQSNELPCPPGRYFNRNTRTCAAVKPEWCI